MRFKIRLIFRYMKNNIYRTMITILGLVISISMIVFILMSIISLNKTSLNETVREEGFQDFTIDGIDDNIFNKVLLTKNISRLAKVNTNKKAVKYYRNLHGNEALSSFLIKDVQKDYFDHFFKKRLVDGRLPIKQGEAIVPYSVKETIEELRYLDNEISLDCVSAADFDKFIKNFSFFEGDYSNYNLEKINEIRNLGFNRFIEKNYSKDRSHYGLEKIKIVGYYSSGFSSVGVLYKDNIKNSISREIDYIYGDIIRLNNFSNNNYSADGIFSRHNKVSETKDKLDDLIFEKKGAKLAINDSVVLLKNNKMFNSLVSFFLTALLILIIIISIYVFIFNIFTTNFQDKLRDISLLRVVGFTNRQMLKTFFIEGFFYWLISFPLGYMLGQALLKNVIYYTQYVFDNSISGLFIRIKYDNSIWVFIGSFIISTGLIFISQLIAAKNLYKTMPIKAINNIFIYDKGDKPTAYQKIIKKVIGYEGYLSIRYAIKNKRQFIITTVSITISMVIFVFTTFLIKSFDIQVEKIVQKNDKSYGILESRNTKKTIDFMSDMRKIKGIDVKNNISYAEVRIIVEKEEIKNQSNVLILIDDKTYEQNFFEYKDDESILVSTNPIKDGKITYSTIGILPKNGEENTRALLKNVDKKGGIGSFFNIRIVDKAKLEILSYMKDFENYDNVLLARMSSFQKINTRGYKFSDVIELFKYGDNPNFEDQVMSYLVKYPTFKIDSYDLPIVNLLKLYSGGLIFVIILIAILNVFNTTYNNIMTRRRDMALIRAVGIEEHRIRKIVINQSIMPVTIASILSFIIVSILIGIIYSLQKNQIGWKMLSVIYPLFLYVLAVAFTFIIVFSTALLQMKSIEKYNIMNELKRI